jgi:hypothetical protein
VHFERLWAGMAIGLLLGAVRETLFPDASATQSWLIGAACLAISWERGRREERDSAQDAGKREP